jgi:hypothetical protein
VDEADRMVRTDRAVSRDETVRAVRADETD